MNTIDLAESIRLETIDRHLHHADPDYNRRFDKNVEGLRTDFATLGALLSAMVAEGLLHFDFQERTATVALNGAQRVIRR